MKFQIGQKVRCRRVAKFVGDPVPFDFVGTVEARADTGEGIEYRVSNSPQIFPGIAMLIWEHEIVGVVP